MTKAKVTHALYPNKVADGIEHVRTDVRGCATELKRLADELSGHVAAIADAGPETLRLTAIAMNAAAVRATFSALTTRSLGERLAMLSELLAASESES